MCTVHLPRPVTYQNESEKKHTQSGPPSPAIRRGWPRNSSFRGDKTPVTHWFSSKKEGFSTPVTFWGHLKGGPPFQNLHSLTLPRPRALFTKEWWILLQRAAAFSLWEVVHQRGDCQWSSIETPWFVTMYVHDAQFWGDVFFSTRMWRCVFFSFHIKKQHGCVFVSFWGV